MQHRLRNSATRLISSAVALQVREARSAEDASEAALAGGGILLATLWPEGLGLRIDFEAEVGSTTHKASELWVRVNPPSFVGVFGVPVADGVPPPPTGAEPCKGHGFCR